MSSTLHRWTAKSLSVLIALLPSTPALADPCGMVWAIQIAGQAPIRRIGVQQTYMFHARGIETIVLRPGYSGRAEDFGMLIPFPSPPSVRKVPDEIFAHIDAAIEPPEVVVRLPSADEFWMGAGRLAAPMIGGAMTPGGAGPTVRLLREETVGMYEVAVLEAGSARALARWMEAHGYRYPDGMDATCDDYIADGWCFVAVKTRLMRKAGVDAKPGMRSVDPTPTDGRFARFDGFVQAMGFRFRVDEPVLPMRLSVFNEGAERNIVYALTDGCVRFANLPARFVAKHVPGHRLQRHVTEPLPLRVVGGTEKAIPRAWRDGVARRRDPFPLNGFAKELFAADLIAAEAGELLLPHEQVAKTADERGRRLGHDGPALARYVEDAVAAADDDLDRGLAQGLLGLRGMTLTVLDGEFPADVLAAENLTFEPYRSLRIPTPRSGKRGELVPPVLAPRSLAGWIACVAGTLLAGAWVALQARRRA